MEVDVKYQTGQQTKEKALAQLIKLFRELLGVDVSIRANQKDNTVNENTETEFNQRMQKSLSKNKGTPEIEPLVSLYELSFLKKLISGEFENFTADQFQTKKDKRLFEKFNSMSKKLRQDKYISLKKQLDLENSK